MACTLEDTAEARENLLKRHPELNKIEIVGLEETGFTLERIASFIHKCWRTDYPEGLTIVSKPSIIWNAGGGQMHGPTSWAALDEHNQLVGLAIGYKRTFRLDGISLESAMSTGASVLPERRGQGIIQHIRLHLQRQSILAGAPLLITWFDTRNNAPGSAYKIYERDPYSISQKVALHVKTLDYRIAFKYGGINIFEKLVIYFSSFVFNRNGKPLGGVYVIDEQELEAALAFRSKQLEGKRFWREHDRRSWERQTAFQRPGFETVCLTLKSNGEIEALLYGYIGETNQGDNMFYVDGLLFSRKLPFGKKRRWLAGVENWLKNEKKCFAVVGIGTAFSENPIKFGYLPVAKQTVAATMLDENLMLSPRDLSDSFMELR